MAVIKYRLDELLVKKNLVETIKKAQALIVAGDITVNGDKIDKAGVSFTLNVDLKIKQKCPYVSRGGYKLEGGLDSFNINPQRLICADIGASTGGFTDCLLQRGAEKVYAVDVGYGQFDWKLRQDKRVILIERFNARKLTAKQIPEKMHLAVIDASFISITKLIYPLLPLLSHDANIIGLIKPQFELPKNKIEKGGVVKDKKLHQEAIDKVSNFALENNLEVVNITTSPIKGPKGNKEFLILLKPNTISARGSAG